MGGLVCLGYFFLQGSKCQKATSAGVAGMSHCAVSSSELDVQSGGHRSGGVLQHPDDILHAFLPPWVVYHSSCVSDLAVVALLACVYV